MYYRYFWAPSRRCSEVLLSALLKRHPNGGGKSFNSFFSFKTLPFSKLNPLSRTLSKRAWRIMQYQLGKFGSISVNLLFCIFIFTGLFRRADVHATFFLYILLGIRYAIYDIYDYWCTWLLFDLPHTKNQGVYLPLYRLTDAHVMRIYQIMFFQLKPRFFFFFFCFESHGTHQLPFKSLLYFLKWFMV